MTHGQLLFVAVLVGVGTGLLFGGAMALPADAADDPTGVQLSSPASLPAQAEDRSASPPDAGFVVGPERPDVDEPVVLDASETAPRGGEIVSYDWEVDGEPVADGERARHQFEEPGTHELTLTVTDDTGARSSVMNYVHVGEPDVVTDPTPGEVVEPQRETLFETEPEVDLTIPFRTGDVRLAEGVDRAVLDSDREQQWVVLQFGERPSQRETRALDELGVDRQGKLTDRTFYAGVPRENVEDVADLPSVRSVAAVQPEWKLSPRLQEEFEDSPDGEREPVEIGAFEPLDALAEEYRLERNELGLYVGQLNEREVRDLQQRQAVRWIEPEVEFTPDLAEAKRLTGTQSEPFIGEQADDVRVGVIDSGIAHDHTHFDTVEIVDSYDSIDEDWDPSADDFDWDPNDHGTHVAGIVAGAGFDGPPDDEATRGHTGVATNATLVVARGFSVSNFDRVSQNGSDIITNSWGGHTQGAYTERATYVDGWAYENPDVLLLGSYGNYNTSNPDEQWGNTPGLEKNVLAVGSLDDGSANITDDWQLHRDTVERVNDVHSLNNLTQPQDGRTKPDINAPATPITAPVPATYTDDLYGTKGGSSMSTPHVAGIAALYESTYDDPWADEIKASIIAGAGPVENPAPDERPEGHGAADAYPSIYKTGYEHEHVIMSGTFEGGTFSSPDQATRTFEVPSDAERVVTALSWTDFPGTSATSDNQVNDLDLYLGPTDDPERYSSASQTDTVERLEIDDLDDSEVGTTWQLTVDPVEIDESPQHYAAVSRVVTEKPELSVTAPDELVVEPTPNARTAFEFEVEGEGASVHGTRATVHSDSALDHCGGQRGFIIGVLDGDRADFSSDDMCFEVPDQPGTYPVDITVDSTNAERETIEETVDVRVPEPRVELDPYELNVTVGEEKQYAMYLSNVSTDVETVEANVSLDRPEIGVFTEFTTLNLADGDDYTIELDPDGNWIRLELEESAVDATDDDGEVTLGLLTAGGSTPGKSPVNVSVAELRDGDGDVLSLRPDQQAGTPERGLLNVTRGPIELDDDSSITIDPPGDLTPISDVVFDAGPVIDVVDDPLGVQWDLGDGRTVDDAETVRHSYDEPGEYTVSVVVENATDSYRVTETVVVEKAEPDPAPEPVAFDSYEVSETTLHTGDEITVEATVTNRGNESGTVEVPLVLDGEVVAERQVTVPPGERESVQFRETFETAGDYTLTVGELDPTTVTVETEPAEREDDAADDTEDDAADDTEDDPTPGFGIVGTLAGVGGVAYLLKRRLDTIGPRIKQRQR